MSDRQREDVGEPVDEVASSWDAEYTAGRYDSEPPVPFVADIVSTARRFGLGEADGMYIGCGNGRNYVPLVESGLDLVGIDVSSAAVEQLRRRMPDRLDRICLGDLSVVPEDARFSLVIGIQVFQAWESGDGPLSYSGCSRSSTRWRTLLPARQCHRNRRVARP